MYDIIGDVHGEAVLLKKLLKKMGYRKADGIYSHPERTAIFVGDFINRGPEIKKTIRIIRSMVDAGKAKAVLGNHELNAIIYYMKDKQGLRLVKQPSKNYLSLFKTINEFTVDQVELKDHLHWLRTLPLFLDLGDIRIVHACWDNDAIRLADQIHEPEGHIRKTTIRSIHKKAESEISKAVWLLTKGVLLKLPADLRVRNNKGVAPRSLRLRWWEMPQGKTFRELSFEGKYTMPEYTVPAQILPQYQSYPEDAPPVFFGHYCRGNGPVVIRQNICCVDSCVTGTGTLTAYRWHGEKTLSVENVVQVR